MRDILEEISTQLEQRAPFAIATLVGEEGSTPRAAGARMVVRDDGSTTGTVGGGLLEATAIREAIGAIETAGSRLVTVELRGDSVASTQMICGGRAEILVAFVPVGDPTLIAVCGALRSALEDQEPAWLVTSWVPADGMPEVRHGLVREGRETVGEVPGDDRWLRDLVGDAVIHRSVSPRDGAQLLVERVDPPSVVVIFGAGHVSQALAPAAAAVGFDVVVVDDRPEFASAVRFPTVGRLVVPDTFERALEGLSIGARTYLVIVTRGHAHDFTVLEQALHSSAGYIGLMASSRKRRRFFEELLRRGFGEADISRVHTPIGLPIGAETPAELAVSIVAELVKVRAENAR